MDFANFLIANRKLAKCFLERVAIQVLNSNALSGGENMQLLAPG